MAAWIWGMFGSGAVAAILLSVVGYLGRQQIGAWLNKDLERLKAQQMQALERKKAEYQLEMETNRADQQRQLEAYKVTLIAEAERSKAGADIKKAGALLVVEKQFNAIDKLHTATLGNYIVFSGALEDSPDECTPERFQQLSTRYALLKGALEQAELFLTSQERREVIKYVGALGDIRRCCRPGTSAQQREDAIELEGMARETEIDVDKLLRRKVQEMMSMSG